MLRPATNASDILLRGFSSSGLFEVLSSLKEIAKATAHKSSAVANHNPRAEDLIIKKSCTILYFGISVTDQRNFDIRLKNNSIHVILSGDFNESVCFLVCLR